MIDQSSPAFSRVCPACGRRVPARVAGVPLRPVARRDERCRRSAAVACERPAASAEQRAHAHSAASSMIAATVITAQALPWTTRYCRGNRTKIRRRRRSRSQAASGSARAPPPSTDAAGSIAVADVPAAGRPPARCRRLRAPARTLVAAADDAGDSRRARCPSLEDVIGRAHARRSSGVETSGGLRQRLLRRARHDSHQRARGRRPTRRSPSAGRTARRLRRASTPASPEFDIAVVRISNPDRRISRRCPWVRECSARPGQEVDARSGRRSASRTR